MSRFAPPAADPHGLRDAARRLTQVGQHLQASGGEVGASATATLPAWQGTASVLMAARAQGLRSSSGQQESALGAVAQATVRYADDVEQAQTQVRRLNEMWDEAEWRASRVEDGAAELADTRAELQQRYARVNDELEEHGYSLQRALATGDPTAFLPTWVAGGVRTGQAAVKGWGIRGRAVAWGRYSSLLWQVSRWYRFGQPAVRAAVLGSDEYLAFSRSMFGKTSTLPVVGKAMTASGRAFLPMTLYSSTTDVFTGGGYEGWRDPATRVAGAVGAAGSGALIAANLGMLALGPVGLAIAGGAVLAYSAWSLGNFVYDHRAAIGAFFGRARDATVRVASAAGAAVSRTVSGAKDALVSGGRELAGAAASTGRKVLDVLSPPRWLVPHVAGLF